VYTSSVLRVTPYAFIKFHLLINLNIRLFLKLLTMWQEQVFKITDSEC
jgi:hypothetical protein